MAQNKKAKGKYIKESIFKQVASYLILPEAVITLIPFGAVLLSLLFRLFNASGISEFIWGYIAFPLFFISPVFITLKQVNTLKKSFPRKADAHKVILAVFSFSAISFLLTILLFVISCYVYSMFPLEFYTAAYTRDMFSSSPAAMIISFITLFFAYALISQMSTTAFFMGEAAKKKYSFTLSCFIFFVMYTILLLCFVLSYFAATFINIKSLEYIQIANSPFNSSMLCSFITFIAICFPALPILYNMNYKALNKLDAPSKTK